MTADERQARGVEKLLGPSGFEVSCEQCFELLDRYVDLEFEGGDPNEALPGMRTHLTGCPACQEDYESLRDLVLADGGGFGSPC